jgi:uncharacterized membrane protein
MDKSRVEAFSDGVFAIAITLLVLELKVPDVKEGLDGALWHNWPSYAAYVVSFAVIGIMWVNHHAMFHRVRVVDRPLLFLNLLLLMFVALVPFPTALVARYLGHPGAHVAMAVYSGNMFLTAIAWQLLWRWIVHDDRLLHEQVDPEIARGTRRRFALGVFVYAGTVGMSFINAKVTLTLHALIAVYYVFDQLGIDEARNPA